MSISTTHTENTLKKVGYLFSNKNPSWGGDGEGMFIRRGRLKEGGVHKLFLILGEAFIVGRSLKELRHLLEDLPHKKVSFTEI